MSPLTCGRATPLAVSGGQQRKQGRNSTRLADLGTQRGVLAQLSQHTGRTALAVINAAAQGAGTVAVPAALRGEDRAVMGCGVSRVGGGFMVSVAVN